ncbi:MAG: hypothetical protein ACFFCQ_04255 [Promethearchaeota archaeon]
MNWTLEVIVGFVSLIPVSIGLLLTAYHFWIEKNRSLLFLMLSWFCLTIWILFEVLSYLFLDKFLFRTHNNVLIPLAIFIALLSDSISRDSIEPIKIAVISVVSVLLFIFSLEPDSVIIDQFRNGDETFAMTGDLRIAASTQALIIGLTLVYYMGKIHLNSPKNLKFYSSLNLAGASLMGIVSSIFVALELTMEIPGVTLATISIGSLFISIAFISQPKLAFVLPFRAMKLTVVEINSGIPLYTHSWSKKVELIDDTVFSGMISGLSSFINIALGKGNVREIHLDQAILLLERIGQFPVAFVLFASKSSPSLRNALNLFAERFTKEFSQHYSAKIVDADKYKTAADLVLSCFPFVPDWD